MSLNKFKEYYNKNSVEDIMCKENNHYVFILESPHNDEIKKNHVAAGTSGKSMSKFMGLGEDKSFGEYVLEKAINGTNISILNVSTSPLQEVNNLKYEYKELIDKVDKIIRNGYINLGKHQKNNDYLNNIETFLINDLKKRIRKAKIDTSTKFIICGDFAETYFNNISLNNIDINNIICVPHPSRGQWENGREDGKYANLKHLKNIFRNKK